MDVLDEMGNGELDDILDVLFGTYLFVLISFQRTRLTKSRRLAAVSLRTLFIFEPTHDGRFGTIAIWRRKLI